MANIFLISDHHIGHSNILTFLKSDGTKLRDFAHIDAHNEHIVEQHNKTVRPGDKTYFLGDFCFTNKYLHFLDRMNGEKVLIKGNHDTLKLSQYTPYFKDIRGSHQFDGILMTHIPVHPESLARWPLNVHGHLHANVVMKQAVKNQHIQNVPDHRYFNVSCEQLNYTPISLEELKAKARNFGIDFNVKKR